MRKLWGSRQWRRRRNGVRILCVCVSDTGRREQVMELAERIRDVGPRGDCVECCGIVTVGPRLSGVVGACAAPVAVEFLGEFRYRAARDGVGVAVLGGRIGKDVRVDTERGHQGHIRLLWSTAAR